MGAQGQITTNPFALSADAALMSKPDYQRRVYSSPASRYDQFKMVVDRMNNYNSERTDNPKYFWAVSPPAQKALKAAVNSTVLGNGNLEVTLNIPSGGTNFYRLTEVLQDNNYAKGVVVNKTTSTVELQKIDGTAWNASTQFVANTTLKIIGNAQIYGGSRSMETLNYTTTEDYNYHQIKRESHTIVRRDLNKKTWYTNRNGKYWSDFDLQKVNERYLKSEMYTAYYGERNIIGTENDLNARYFSDGVRNKVITKNSDLYMPLSNQLSESLLQDFLSTFKTRTKLNNVMAFVGSEFRANFQANISKQYLLTAGNTNTFGGVDVSGLDVMVYDFNGIKMAMIEWDLFNDPINNDNISTITGKPKEQSSAFFMSPEMIMDSTGKGMLPPVVPKHLGPNRCLAGFIKGFVESESITPDMFDNALNLGGTFASDVDAVTYGVYGDNSYLIEPQNMGIIELAF